MDRAAPEEETKGGLLILETPLAGTKRGGDVSVGSAANERRAMGNHLVAKLAFFPPDPVKYTQKGPFHRGVRLEWLWCAECRTLLLDLRCCKSTDHLVRTCAQI